MMHMRPRVCFCFVFLPLYFLLETQCTHTIPQFPNVGSLSCSDFFVLHMLVTYVKHRYSVPCGCRQCGFMMRVSIPSFFSYQNESYMSSRSQQAHSVDNYATLTFFWRNVWVILGTCLNLKRSTPKIRRDMFGKIWSDVTWLIQPNQAPCNKPHKWPYCLLYYSYNWCPCVLTVDSYRWTSQCTCL